MPGEKIRPQHWQVQILEDKFPNNSISDPIFEDPSNLVFADLAADIVWGAGETQIQPQFAITLFDKLKTIIPETEPGILELNPSDITRIIAIYKATIGIRGTVDLDAAGRKFTQQYVDSY